MTSMMQNPNPSQHIHDQQNNNPEKNGLEKPPFVPSSTAFDLDTLLQGVSHFILKSNFVPIEIGVPYSDEALKYDVFDQTGQRLFIACESSKYCKICCWKTGRPFVFFILDSTGQKIFKVTRPCGCCCCCGVTCCGDMCCNGVRITMEDGSDLGSVSQKFRCCKPVYTLRSQSTPVTFLVKGPCCGFCIPCRLCCDSNFRIRTDDKTSKKVGKIEENWTEFSQIPEFAEGENFGASFPKKWSASQKATVLGALLLINLLHFDFDPCSPSQYFC